MENKYIGKLWLNESKNGNKYMAGSIDLKGERIKIIIFKNNNKRPDKKDADYNILLSEPIKTEQNAQIIENNNEIAGVDFQQSIDDLKNISF